MQVNRHIYATLIAQYPQLQLANFGFWTDSWRRLAAMRRGIFEHKNIPGSPKTKRAKDIIYPISTNCVYATLIAIMSRWSKNPKILLILIFLTGLLLRFYKLGSLPGTMTEDEVLLGVVGRYLVTTGRDIYGNFMPMWYFDKFGDYYIIGPFYLTGLSTAIFGATTFAVRFPTAISGALGSLVIYCFAWEVFGRRKVALATSLLYAISPIFVVASRNSTEGILGGVVFVAALGAWLSATKTRSIAKLALGSTLMLLTYFVYHPFRLYAPFSALALLILYMRHHAPDKKIVFGLAISTLIYICLTGYISSTPWGRGRFDQTSIFGRGSGVAISISTLNSQISGQPLVARVLHNKPTEYGLAFAKQYFNYLNPNFMFGDIWTGVTTLPGTGPLYLVHGLLLLVAALNLKRVLHIQSVRYFLIILAFTLVPASLTYIESPNINRSMVYFMLLCPLAAWSLADLPRSNARMYGAYLIMSVLLVVELSRFAGIYILHFDKHNALKRPDALRELVAYVSSDPKSSYVLPATKTAPLTYMWYAGIFDPKLIGKFETDAYIPRINHAHFASVNCPSYLTRDQGRIPYRFVVDEYSCDKPGSTLKFVRDIKGQGELLGYKVYEVAK